MQTNNVAARHACRQTCRLVDGRDPLQWDSSGGGGIQVASGGRGLQWLCQLDMPCGMPCANCQAASTEPCSTGALVQSSPTSRPCSTRPLAPRLSPPLPAPTCPAALTRCLPCTCGLHAHSTLGCITASADEEALHIYAAYILHGSAAPQRSAACNGHDRKQGSTSVRRLQICWGADSHFSCLCVCAALASAATLAANLWLELAMRAACKARDVSG